MLLAVSTHTQMRAFNLQRLDHGEVQNLSVSGGMDNDASNRVGKVLVPLLEQKPRREILDLCLLSTTSTMSLARLMVSAREFRRHGGELDLAGLATLLKLLAVLAEFARRKDFAPDMATALKAMSPTSEVKANSALEKK